MSCQFISLDNVEHFITQFDTVLTDCDGVLWHGSSVIPGAVDTIQKLHNMGKHIFYITNNSTKSRAEYVKKCTQMGFPATKESIVGSAYVAAQYIHHHLKYTGKVFVMGSTGIERELAEVGLQCIGIGPDHIDDKNFDDLVNMELDPEVKCVVVGLDKHFSYMKLARTISYLARDGCHFVVTNTDSGLPTGSGVVLPGTGSLVTAVEVASGRTADVICGKPHPPIFDTLRKAHHVVPSRTLLIGDRLNTDIQLAGRCGLHSLLVLTGFSNLQEVEERKKGNTEDDKHQIPEYCVDSLAELGRLVSEVGL